jgi:hypothetical protein
MSNTWRLDEITKSIIEALPADTRQITRDLKKNLRAALSASLARLDLVTREEFDVQAALLARTRERLEEMERRVGELKEAKGKGSTRASSKSKGRNKKR